MTENMGLAKISGGTYKIADGEGRAIESIVPLAAIQSIDWDILTDVQTWLLSEMVIRWEILAHWLVSCRTRAVDTQEMPFTSLEFLDQEAKADLYSIQLDLCAVIWKEIENIKDYYLTPYDWWIDCIRENQYKQIKSILLNRDGITEEEIEEKTRCLRQALNNNIIPYAKSIENTRVLNRNGITKGEVEDETRYLRQALNNDRIPYAKSIENTHLYTMFDFAIKLRRENYEKVRDYWNRYLKQLNTLAKELKTNNEIKAIIRLGGRLYYRDRNTLKLIPINRVKKDTVLNIRAGFFVIDQNY